MTDLTTKDQRAVWRKDARKALEAQVGHLFLPSTALYDWSPMLYAVVTLCDALDRMEAERDGAKAELDRKAAREAQAAKDTAALIAESFNCELAARLGVAEADRDALAELLESITKGETKPRDYYERKADEWLARVAAIRQGEEAECAWVAKMTAKHRGGK